ncbi:MAG: Uma2 family endonuclease [Actinomycetota bacterium]
MSVEVRKRLFTVEEFHRMGEAGILDDDARLELWGGEIYEMPPIGPAHQGDVNVLTTKLVRALGDRAIVSVQGPIVLDDYYEPLPDLAVLRPRDDFYRKAHPRPADVFLLVEVADTTLRRDRREKMPVYATAGIPEAWLLDITGRRLEVYSRPSPDGYKATTILTPGELVSPQAFPDVVLAVEGLIG